MSSKNFFRLLLFAIVFFSVALPEDAFSMPFFARKIGRDCTYCHTAFPKLNETGRIYRSNGYRFADEEEWMGVKDLLTVPASLEAEVEALYNRTRTGGVWDEESDMVVEEVELMGGGAFGKTGRVSVLAVFGVEGHEDGSYESFMGPAFVQVNDLVGGTGNGMLNVRAGQWEVALPFLASAERVIHNKYLAHSTLGVFTPEQRAVELNGMILGEEETNWPTHRFHFGITREDANDAHKMQGFYGVYSLTIREHFSIGGIFRHGKEKNGAVDVRYSRYGGAAEAEVGPVVLTGAFFKAEREGGLADQENYMAELLLIPIEQVILGARFDVVSVKSLDDARAYTGSVRYNILSNVYAQAEFRALKDIDHITSSSEKERKVRLFLVALF